MAKRGVDLGVQDVDGLAAQDVIDQTDLHAILA